MSSTDLHTRLNSLRRQGRKALVPYFMGLWPDRSTFADLLLGAFDAGADAVEVGLPYSDPLADGPVIQQAGQDVLSAKMGPADVLEVLAGLALPVPVILMTYVNPVLRRGVERFWDDCVGAGVEGLIVPDLPPEEAGAFTQKAEDRGITLITMVAPTTPPERMGILASGARGFIYLVSVCGVTGARPDFLPVLEKEVRALRPHTDTPVYAGFGIAGPAQAKRAAQSTDGVVVGSALLETMTAHPKDPAGAAAELLQRLRTALDELEPQTTYPLPGRIPGRTGGAA